MKMNDGQQAELCLEEISTALTKFTEAYELIISGIHDLGYNTNNQNFHGTPARAARGLLEMIADQNVVEHALADIKRATFEVDHNDMIFINDIRSSGICPHHILPVMYSTCVGYIPSPPPVSSSSISIGSPKVVGLSKLPRLVKILSRRPACQEELVNLICNYLYGEKSLIPTMGCGVSCRAIHTCMRCRGVEEQSSIAIVNAVRGIFLDKPGVREEFMSLSQQHSWP